MRTTRLMASARPPDGLRSPAARCAKLALAARNLLALALVLYAALALAGCHGGPMREHHHTRHHGFTGDTSTVQIVTTQLGGKNVFIPSTIVVTSGHPVKLSIFNTTEIPHGFAIPALNIADVLPPQKEHEIELPALEGHQVLQITCHLHAAHRTATLVVLPAKDAQH